VLSRIPAAGHVVRQDTLYGIRLEEPFAVELIGGQHIVSKLPELTGQPARNGYVESLLSTP
jgi:hypothetical protein